MLRCTCPTPAGVHAARKGGCYGRRTFARKERLFLCRSQLQGCTGQAENQVDSHRLSKVAIGAALIVGAAVVVLPVSLLAQPLVLQRARFLVPLAAQSPVPFRVASKLVAGTELLKLLLTVLQMVSSAVPLAVSSLEVLPANTALLPAY